jgi:hypothetical protein
MVETGHALPIRSIIPSGVVAREPPFVIYASRRLGFARSRHQRSCEKLQAPALYFIRYSAMPVQT